MSKKSKIELIIKILLILVLVPFGVVSWAENVSSMATQNLSDIKGNPFYEPENYGYHGGYDLNNPIWNYEMILDENNNLTDNNRNDNFTNATAGHLAGNPNLEACYWRFARIFKTVQEHLGYNYNTFVVRTYNKDEPKPDDWIGDDGYKYNTASGHNENGFGGYDWYLGKLDNEIIIEDVIPSQQTAQAQIDRKNKKVQNITSDWSDPYFSIMREYTIEDREFKDIDLTNTTLSSKSSESHNIAYMISFFDRNAYLPNEYIPSSSYPAQSLSRGYYNYDIVQRALMKINGNEDAVRPDNFGNAGYTDGINGYHDDDGVVAIINQLIKANDTYANFAKAKESGHDLSKMYCTVDKDKVGTYIAPKNNQYNNDDYIVVGPFHMCDHLYASEADGRDAIKQFSGKDITKYPECLGGLIDCTITIKDSNGNSTTYNSDTSDDFCICYDKTGYTKTDKNTNYTIGFSNLKTPSQYKNNKVPYPDQDFYIKIKASKVNNGDYLSNLTFTARDTIAEGTGSKFTYRMQEKRYSLKSGTKGYKCTLCGEDFTQEEYDNSWDTEENNGKKYHNCTLWKDDGKVYRAQNLVYKNSLSYEENQWKAATKNNQFRKFRCMMYNSELDSEHEKLFEQLYKHVTGESLQNSNKFSVDQLNKLKKGEGIKCSTCKATVFVGSVNRNPPSGTDIPKEYLYIGIELDGEGRTGTDGFLRVYQGHYTGNGMSFADYIKCPETWYIDTDISCLQMDGIPHYHNPSCYKFQQPTQGGDSGDMGCGKFFNAQYHKLTGVRKG